MGDVLHTGELGSPAQNEIRDVCIPTTIGNMPFDVTIYKVGDKYAAEGTRQHVNFYGRTDRSRADYAR